MTSDTELERELRRLEAEAAEATTDEARQRIGAELSDRKGVTPRMSVATTTVEDT